MITICFCSLFPKSWICDEYFNDILLTMVSILRKYTFDNYSHLIKGFKIQLNCELESIFYQRFSVKALKILKKDLKFSTKI